MGTYCNSAVWLMLPYFCGENLSVYEIINHVVMMVHIKLSIRPDLYKMWVEFFLFQCFFITSKYILNFI